jgi:hypothetical protein
MACGSVPVVYADGWMFPFGKNLINWTEAAVIIHEEDIFKTISILSQISEQERCRMRQKVLEIYRKYIETGRGTILGIIENFELLAATETRQSSVISDEISPSTEVVGLDPISDTTMNSSTLLNLYDNTVIWDPAVNRSWLDPAALDPPAMLLLTNFAWNHPNQTYGIQQYRGIRSAELYEGIVNHPWFHPTAWEDIENGRMQISNSTRYYVFFDFETCREHNYPYYGYGPMANRDLKLGRGDTLDDFDRYIEKLFSLTIFQLPNVKGILFDCGGNGPNKQLKMVRRVTSRMKLNIAFISESVRWFKSGPYDQGLPPP